MLGGREGCLQRLGLASLDQRDVGFGAVVGQQLFDHPQLGGRVGRVLVGPLQGGRHQHVGGGNLIDKADPGRFDAVDGAPRQAEVAGRPPSASLNEPSRARQLGRDAHLHEPARDLRGVGGDEAVARQDEGEPEPDRRPVDGGDDGLRIADNRVPCSAAWGRRRSLGAVGLRLEHGLDIGTGAESTSGAGDDERADRAVVVAGLDRVCQLDGHGREPRVEPVGSVERQDGDGAVRLVGDVVVLVRGHARP